MNRAKAIAIAAIATLIFGSVAIGITANSTSNGDVASADAVSTAPTDVPASTNDAAQPAGQPVFIDLNTTADDDEDDSDRDDNDDRYEHDSRGRDHEEDD